MPVLCSNPARGDIIAAAVTIIAPELVRDSVQPRIPVQKKSLFLRLLLAIDLYSAIRYLSFVFK
jgi:type III secretion system FlhB-like substrate exporter